MLIRPGSLIPTIGLYESNVARHSQQRARDVAEFERRRQIEQGMGVDRALREALKPQPGGAGAVPVQAPMPGPVQGGPAIQAYSAGGPPGTVPVSVAPDTGGDTEIGTIVEDQPVEAAPAAAPAIAAPGVVASAAPVAPAAGVPAGVPASATPPTPGVTAAAAGAPAIASYGTVMDRLAGTPGSGATMLALHQKEQTLQSAERNRQALAAGRADTRKIQAWGAFNTALDKGNVDAARALAAQYQLGIPDQAWGSLQFRQAMMRGNDYASKMYHAQDPDRPIWLQSYMSRIASGQDEQTAANGAGQDVEKKREGTTVLRGRKRLVTDQATGKQYWVDEFGNKVDTGTKGRVYTPGTGRGGAGGGGKLRVQSTKELSDGRIALVMSDGTTRIAVDQNNQPLKGPGGARMAAGLVGRIISSDLEQTPESRGAAVDQALDITRRVQQGGTQPNPRPPLGSFGRRPPLSDFERR